MGSPWCSIGRRFVPIGPFLLASLGKWIPISARPRFPSENPSQRQVGRWFAPQQPRLIYFQWKMIHWAVLSGHVLRLVIAFCFVILLVVNDVRRWTKSGPTSSPLVQAILKSAACLLIGDTRPILIWFHVEALRKRSQGDPFLSWVLYSVHRDMGVATTAFFRSNAT